MTRVAVATAVKKTRKAKEVEVKTLTVRVGFAETEVLPCTLEDEQFNVYTKGGEGDSIYYEFINPQHSWMFGYLRNACTKPGIGLSTHEFASFKAVFPIDLLAEQFTMIESEFTSRGMDDQSSYIALRESLEVIVKAKAAAAAERLGQGFVENQHVNILFPVGAEVYGEYDEERVAGIIEKVEFRSTWGGSYWRVAIKVLHSTSGDPQEGFHALKMPAIRGVARVEDLAIKLMTPEVKEVLSARGADFRTYSKTGSYLSYQGTILRESYWSPKTYRGDGRVIIDMNSLKRIDSNYASDMQNQCGIDTSHDEYDDDDGSKAEKLDEIADDQLWRTWPFLHGFSFAAKTWGRFHVKGLSPIKFREDAFDKLVLPEKKKALIRALVEHSDGSFQDLIDGKGGGTIFLLHGEPGQGKTLTAEALSELLKRPLYSISVGELGTNPDVLEDRLRQILDLASIWNAVLLLDEADIFLEARDEHDLVRNAMVGVFLRLLEYHQGTMFLTTNRVRNLDKAFYSRISIAIRYASMQADTREKIWNNLLSAARVTGINAASIAHHDLNGRQIKNILKLAQTLARSEDVMITADHITRCIDETEEFNRVIDEAPKIFSEKLDLDGFVDITPRIVTPRMR